MTPEILLIPSPPSFGNPSMGRYAEQLYAGLQELNDGSRTIRLETSTAHRSLSRTARWPPARRFRSAWFSFVEYPLRLRGRKAAVFHILDHAFAHVIRSLDAERTVVTCHDLIPLLAAEGVISLPVSASLARSFRWRIGHLRKARRIIAVSQTTKATIERYAHVRAERITVIPQGVAPVFRMKKEEASLTRTQAGLADASAVLVQVASRVRYKNTPALLHALAELRARLGAGVVLIRIGAPMFEDEVRLASRLGVLHAIRDLGPVDDPTLIRWYNAADVLVFPSLWEGFGWPPLEAMACGTPVVASDTPAVAELVQEAGLLVPAADPGALARAICRVLTESSLAASLRQKGLVRAGEFTWTRTATATAAVYDQVLQ